MAAARITSKNALELYPYNLRNSLDDEKLVPYRSTHAGVCHACGHDVHTTVLLGAGLFLAEQAAAGALPGRVRLVFQPAEEAAGGALDVLAAGGLASVGRIFALHCDPRLDAGQLGVRSGAITAAWFLAEFVGDTPWCHLDIAGPAFNDRGTDLSPRGATGTPVRALVRFVLDRAAA